MKIDFLGNNRWVCRLLGKITERAESALYELVKAPHSLKNQAQHARMPHGYGGHNDGCGVAWLQSNQITLEKRSRDDNWDASFCAIVEKIETTALIAHNRAATPGLVISTADSHPYATPWRGSPSAFCHNGEVTSFIPAAQQRGVTDSLLFMEHFAAHVKTNSLDNISSYLATMSAQWSYSSLNALALDSEGLYAWRWYDDIPDSSFNRERYCSLYLKEAPGEVIICSEPVDESTGWVSIPNRTVLVIKQHGGAIVVDRKTLS